MSEERRYVSNPRPLTSAAPESDFTRRAPDRGNESMISYTPKTSRQIKEHLAQNLVRGGSAKAERLRFMGFGNLFNRRKQTADDVLDEDIVSKYEAARDKLKAKAGWKRHFFFTKAAKQYKQARQDLRHGHLGTSARQMLGFSSEDESTASDDYQGDLNNLIDVGAGEGRKYEPGESEEDPYGNNIVQSGQIDDNAADEEDDRPRNTSEELARREQFYENLW
jgi:hypothetical protein